MIWYGANGFEPSVLTVRAGTTVTFRSRGKPFWPASNFHPLHVLYPEFDAKRQIEPGGEFSFTFGKIGRWRYHNHLQAAHGGVIIVTDAAGNAVNPDCQERDKLASDAVLQMSCWAADIESVLAREGLDAAITRFDQLYTTEAVFAGNCHDVMHLLGEAAYRQFVDTGSAVTTTKTAYCGYGFYHGFIETMLQVKGDYAQAISFCERSQRHLAETIVSPNAIYACYHGIGHGTFDALPQALWGNDRAMVQQALRTCADVTAGSEPIFMKQCATGVFNSLANAYGERLYGLHFTEQDPEAVCREQETAEFQQACYAEVMLAYLYSRYGLTARPELFTAVAAITHPVGGPATMFTLTASQVYRSGAGVDLAEWRTRCTAVPSRLLEACVEGVTEGLMGWGTPGEEYVKPLAWCGTVSGAAARTICYRYVLPRLYTLYSEEKTRTVCATVPEQYRQYCPD